VARFREGSASKDDLRLLTKHFLAVLSVKAPGHAVEVRVPPYAAVQCIGGTRHTRGTPPAVVETDAITWVELAVGDLPWAEAEEHGRLVASGERSDLSGQLPLFDPALP
jgi:Bacterial SCP ortholog